MDLRKLPNFQISHVSNPQISRTTYLKQSNLRVCAITIPPLTRLPPELLALVFEGLDKEERILCVMSHKYWQELIRTLWPIPNTSPNGLLLWVSKSGNTTLMKFAKKWGKFRATNFEDALKWAVEGGQIECMKLLKKWGKIQTAKLSGVFWTAAYNGHIKCMKLLKIWGATNFNWALHGAAKAGQIECMKLLKKWGADNFQSLLMMLGYNNHRNHRGCMTLLGTWCEEQGNG